MQAAHNLGKVTFKDVISHVGVARDFFESNLPEIIKINFDFDTLKLQDGTHIDSALEGSHFDILYRVKCLGISDFAYLYILEYRPTLDKLVPLLLWERVFSIWHARLREGEWGNSLPIVIPLVVCPKAEHYEPVDTKDCKVEEERPWSVIGVPALLDMMKGCLGASQVFLDFFTNLTKKGAWESEYRRSLIYNFTTQAKSENPELLRKMFESGLEFPEPKEIVETFVGHISERGAQMGQAIVLIRLLERKFGAIPFRYLAVLEKASSDTLLRWIDTAIFGAEDIQTVFGC